MRKSLPILGLSLVLLAGCMPAEIAGKGPDGREIRIKFYPGGSALDDLMIIDEINYFGTAQYQIEDPLADIGFRLTSGERVQAECVSTRKNFMDEDECVEYKVYRSSFARIPEGSAFTRPDAF